MTTDNDKPPVDLSDIGAEQVPDEPTTKAREEEKEYEIAKNEVILQGLRQDLTERKDYARRIFKLICFWLAGMILLLLLQGFLSAFGLFILSDTVLVAAISGTTINVLGIFIVVVNYLFPKR